MAQLTGAGREALIVYQGDAGVRGVSGSGKHVPS